MICDWESIYIILRILLIKEKKVIEKSNIIEIENEYKKIDGKWLRLHFQTSVILVIFAFLIECILGCVLYNMGEINIPIMKYIIKYIMSPLILNVFFIVIGYWAINLSNLTQNCKVYIVSLLFVAICFVFFSVHSIFTSTYLIFTIPVLFTMVYGKYLLTTVTALCSIFVKIFSELFVTWDPDKLNIIDNNIRFANFILSLIILSAFYAVCIVVIYFERQKNAASIKNELERYQLKQRLQKDELTAIHNRTALRNAFQSMQEDTAGNSYIFVMIDIDNFKMINDNLGHDIGDLFLIQLGNILKVNCTDVTPFRFGGDEFCILFKNKGLQNVIEICERIQNDFKEIVVVNDIDLPLTVSFGVAQYSREMMASQLLKNADSALYSSKKVKNTIRIYHD